MVAGSDVGLRNSRVTKYDDWQILGSKWSNITLKLTTTPNYKGNFYQYAIASTNNTNDKTLAPETEGFCSSEMMLLSLSKIL